MQSYINVKLYIRMHNFVLSPDIGMLVDTFFEDSENEEFRLQLNRSSREKGAETYSARVLNHWEKINTIVYLIVVLNLHTL